MPPLPGTCLGHVAKMIHASDFKKTICKMQLLRGINLILYYIWKGWDLWIRDRKVMVYSCFMYCRSSQSFMIHNMRPLTGIS